MISELESELSSENARAAASIGKFTADIWQLREKLEGEE